MRNSAANRDLALPLGWFDILNAVPALVYVITPDAEVTFISDYFYTYTGLAKGALIGTTWAEAIHPDDLQDAAANLVKGLAGDEPFKIVQRIRGGDGTYRTYEALTVPVRDARGRIVQWVGAESDVEEYVKTAELLVESESRMKTLLDTIPQLVWTADASGRVDWFNSQSYAFTGQSVREAAVWGWQTTLHPDDLPKVMTIWAESIHTGRAFEMEFRLRRHDGVFRWMLSRVVPLKSPAGDVIRWYGSTTDIDAQKRAEQRRERVASLLQEALLPERLPVVEGVRLDALYLPSESDASIGGDWYDAIALGDGRILLSCGDVTGHGLEAAALAARLRQTIAFAGRERPDPASILERVNAAMIADASPFATAAVAVFDPATAHFEIGLAGHPPPVIAETQRPVRTLSPGGIPLGIDSAATFVTYRCTLTPGAIVAFYTDGLIEFDRDLVRAGDLLEDAVAKLAERATTIEPARFLRDRVFATAGVLRRDDVVVFVMQLATAESTTGHAPSALARTWCFDSSHARSAQTARMEIAGYLRSLAASPDSVGDAELVVGELLANTVEHAPGLVEIVLDWRETFPRLVVADAGSGVGDLDPNRAVPDPLCESGRGLFLVTALADDVVVRPRAGVGTEVACVLRLEKK